MTVAKRYFHGTHRTRPPEETLAAVAPFMEACGITRVADITGLDRIGIPVFTAFRPNARALAISQGKGATPAAARVSAVMEAIEYHLAESPDLPLVHASLEELATRNLATVSVDDLPRMGDSPADPAMRTLWATAREVRCARNVMVPYELVHMDLTMPFAPSIGAFLRTSNGLASGNTPDEALIHAMCELIERDGLAIWAGQNPQHTRIDPDTVDDTEAAALIHQITSAGFQLGLWDITSDLGVPGFLAIVMDASGPGAFPAAGSGCHLDRGVALSRAVTEAVQSRLTYIAGARDDQTRAAFDQVFSASVQDAVRADLAEPATRRFTDIPSLAGADLETDLQTLLSALKAGGLPPPVWVDLSKPDMPVHVVRVFIPGLEGNHDAPGYVPGRRASP